MNYKKLYEKDKDLYVIKICEELSELQTAFVHFHLGKANLEHVIEEIADVIIQLDKINAYISKFDKFKMWNLESKIAKIKENKMEYLEEYVTTNKVCKTCNSETNDMCICEVK